MLMQHYVDLFFVLYMNDITFTQNVFHRSEEHRIPGNYKKHNRLLVRTLTL
ncbi:hypothetical protein CSC05_2764 [Escherichia coli]|nr:hypothetical protein CSC05_2764 [Escherichia coli]